MKVRCINNNGIINGMLRIGEIYEVLDNDGIGYKLSDDLGRDIYFCKERFEIVEEDKEMKFKVGDKVRVREDLVEGNYYGGEYFAGKMEYNKGKVFEIKGICGGAYIFEEDGFHWTDEMLEEVNEEVQEKTFQEVIATIKEGEVWECSDIKIIKDCNSIQLLGISRDTVFCDISKSFKLQRKEYTFEEAFKAYEEGKEIESCEECRFKLIDKDTTLIIDCVGDEMEYSNKRELFSVKEIRGKWYINN